MSQFKRFNASENDNYNSSDAYPEGTLTWDPSNGLRIHDGNTSGGNAVGGGDVYWGDIQNKPNGNTAVHDLIGGASSLDNGKYLKQTTTGVSEWAPIPTTYDTLTIDTKIIGGIDGAAGTQITGIGASLGSGVPWRYAFVGGNDAFGNLFNRGSAIIGWKMYPANNPGAFVTITEFLNNDLGAPSLGFSGSLAEGPWIAESSNYSAGANGPLTLSADTKNWTFGTDGNLTLPAGGDIKNSNGTSVLGGGGTTLPANASGYLNNNGSGTLTWVPGNPSGSGMLPYNGVTVVSNTTTADWTEFTLSGTMDSLWDFNNNVATITLSSATAYGKTITPNTKNMWIVDAKVNSNNNLVVEFPANPTVGDVFTVAPIVITATVNAGSFVVGQTYTIVSLGNTNFTAIGAQFNGLGQSFVATGAGSGTGVATTALGASRLIFKPANGQRARTMSMGQTGPLVFGQGGAYNFMFLDLAGQNVNSPMTWVFAGAIDGIPTWYHTYF